MRDVQIANPGVWFKPADGLEVLISGRIRVYEKSGQYQLYVEEMTPSGLGSLYQAFLIKEKLGRRVCSIPSASEAAVFTPRSG